MLATVSEVITAPMQTSKRAVLACLQAYSRLAAVLGSLHLSSAVVTALEQLAELMKAQGARDPFKTASRLLQARADVRRKQPVHHYRLLGLQQTCVTDEVHFCVPVRQCSAVADAC